MPLCPFCERSVEEPVRTRLKWKLAFMQPPANMFSCPHCDKILGVGTFAN